jgi:sulfur-carrier protein adenylyltransferase/sulfurtransferase
MGVRSRAAAAVLSEAGFKEVYSMKGGINAWEGQVAEGIPEAGMAYFSSATQPEELLGLAWLLEDGSRKFYAEMVSLSEDKEGVALFRELSKAEEKHQASLAKLYRELWGRPFDSEFPKTLIREEPSGERMEGGVLLREALQWAEKKVLKEILELSISLESNAYDLYLKMERKMESENAKKVFKVLSAEEKHHLEQLASLLEKKL